MTRVDFYQIESDEPTLDFTCRLIETIYRQGLKVYVHAESQQQAQQLDDLLWTFRADRFIPHSLHGESDRAPILIGFDKDPDCHKEVLVNLCGAVPNFFSQFDRVTEVLPKDKVKREATRNNYKFYQERGYPLRYHNIQSN
ncbi:MAG: DNA polymerase III subunit chi [Pseudomonadales bacterium]|jgi:DNA polymerase-3 subunit chi|nr:DNA polymerase III subunit chi [Pseudomonadales bacterium]MDP7360614.1 DNA polymerase III subunit chi [Pseudomonadales bacterium]HJN51163.1 DNA polymerase III subunit chi [Pseudomonadales bacterium]|tara:strand:- start:688 stop:1110 length:423 start_codon:yes stop_codon:yes gene_type:complete